jgi:hypothetical protein
MTYSCISASAQLQHLSDIHVHPMAECMRDYLRGYTRSIDYSSDRMLSALAIIRQLLTAHERNEDAPGFDAEEAPKVSLELLTPLSSLYKGVQELKTSSRKTLRRVNDLYDRKLVAKEAVYGEFKTLYNTFDKLVAFCEELLARVVAHYQDRKETKCDLSLSALQHIVYTTTEDFLRQSDVAMFSNASKVVTQTNQGLARLIEALEDENNTDLGMYIFDVIHSY